MDFNSLIGMAAKTGIWALLAILLILYIFKKNEEREKRYITTIDKNNKIIQSLSDSLKCVYDIKDDIENLKICIENKARGGKNG